MNETYCAAWDEAEGSWLPESPKLEAARFARAWLLDIVPTWIHEESPHKFDFLLVPVGAGPAAFERACGRFLGAKLVADLRRTNECADIADRLLELPPSPARDQALALIAKLPPRSLPKAHEVTVSSTNDGSIIIEFIAEHSRLGFTFEPDPSQSGWFLVSDVTAGDMSLSGLLKSPWDLNKLMALHASVD